MLCGDICLFLYLQRGWAPPTINAMPGQFLTLALDEILVGEPLPGALYLYIDMRFLTFRAAEDIVDRATFERLELKRVKHLFITEADRNAFENWAMVSLGEDIDDLTGIDGASQDGGP